MNPAKFEEGSIGIKIRRWQVDQKRGNLLSVDSTPNPANDSSSFLMDTIEAENVGALVYEEIQPVENNKNDRNSSVELQRKVHQSSDETCRNNMTLGIAGMYCIQNKNAYQPGYYHLSLFNYQLKCQVF